MKILMSRGLLCLAVLALLLGGAGSRARAQILYGANGSNGNPSNLYTLDPLTGAATSVIGPIGFAVTGLAFDPFTGVLYGSTANASPTAPGSLITINTTTGMGTLVGPYGIGPTAADITVDPTNGRLFGWIEGGFDDLYEINKATGAATLVGNSGLNTSGSGLAADASGRIYYTGELGNGPLRTVSETTGLTTVVATLSGAPFPGFPINSLAFDAAGTLFGVNTNNGRPAVTHLISINTSTGVITDRGVSVPNLDAIAFAPAAIGVVPEPGTAALLASGLLPLVGMSLGRRRRA